MNKQNVIVFICIVFGYTVSNARISSHEAGRLRGQYTSATEGEQKEILSTLRSSNYANIADQLELVSSRKDIADKAATLAAQESTLAQQQSQISQLNQQTQKLTQEKTQLQQKEQAQQAQLKSQETQLKSQEAMLAQHKKELQTTQSALAEKEKNVATLNSRIIALDNTISAHEREKIALANELKAMRAQKEAIDKELQSLKGGDSEHIKRIGQLDAVIKSKEQELNASKRLSDDCSKKLTAAEKEIAVLKKGNERVALLEREQQELQTQNTDLKKKITEAQQNTASLQNKIKKLEKELAQKDNEWDKKFVEASKEHQKILAEFKVKTTDLERLLETKAKEVTSAKTGENDANNLYNICQKDRDKQGQEISKLKQTVDELQEQLTKLKAKFTQCEEDVEESGQLYEQLEQKHAAEVSTLKKENDALKTKNQKLITELGTAGLVMM